MNIWRQKLIELNEREAREKNECEKDRGHSLDNELALERSVIQWEGNLSPDPLQTGEDNEVIDEAHAMLSRNPSFGWTWEQALEGARRIIAFKRGQCSAGKAGNGSEPLIEMGPTGCPRCKGVDYWITTFKKRLCVDCNDGLVPFKDVEAMGKIKIEGEEAQRPSTRCKAGGKR